MRRVLGWSSRVVPIVAVLLVVLIVWFLLSQGLENADRWASVVGAVVAVGTAAAGVVLWSRHRSVKSSPEVLPDRARIPSQEPAVPRRQYNTLSGSGMLFAVQDGKQEIHRYGDPADRRTDG